MVASVLGGVFGEDLLTDTKGDLRAVGREICTLASVLASDRTYSSCQWSVPFLPSGGVAEIDIAPGLVTVSGGGENVIMQPPCSLHTWSFEGQELNWSLVEELDGIPSHIRASSGHRIEFRCVAVAIEGLDAPMIFVRPLA
jgi:hypothetical protein